MPLDDIRARGGVGSAHRDGAPPTCWVICVPIGGSLPNYGSACEAASPSRQA